MSFLWMFFVLLSIQSSFLTNRTKNSKCARALRNYALLLLCIFPHAIPNFRLGFS